MTQPGLVLIDKRGQAFICPPTGAEATQVRDLSSLPTEAGLPAAADEITEWLIQRPVRPAEGDVWLALTEEQEAGWAMPSTEVDEGPAFAEVTERVQVGELGPIPSAVEREAAGFEGGVVLYVDPIVPARGVRGACPALADRGSAELAPGPCAGR